MFDFVSPRVVYRITKKFPGTSLKNVEIVSTFHKYGNRTCLGKQYLVESSAWWKSLVEGIAQIRMNTDLSRKNSQQHSMLASWFIRITITARPPAQVIIFIIIFIWYKLNVKLNKEKETSKRESEVGGKWLLHKLEDLSLFSHPLLHAANWRLGRWRVPWAYWQASLSESVIWISLGSMREGMWKTPNMTAGLHHHTHAHVNKGVGMGVILAQLTYTCHFTDTRRKHQDIWSSPILFNTFIWSKGSKVAHDYNHCT